jgi:hypothetical protein
VTGKSRQHAKKGTGKRAKAGDDRFEVDSGKGSRGKGGTRRSAASGCQPDRSNREQQNADGERANHFRDFRNRRGAQNARAKARPHRQRQRPYDYDSDRFRSCAALVFSLHASRLPGSLTACVQYVAVTCSGFWCFTAFDINMEMTLALRDWRLQMPTIVRYLVVGLEECPVTGRPHYQGL